jgi:menaquinol-cytochrome c reductase iron-sulfur subunit
MADSRPEIVPGEARRTFLTTIVCGIPSLIAAALAVPAVPYLLYPRNSVQADQWADAGDLSGLAPGKPYQATFRRIRVDGWKTQSEKASAWIVKNPGGELSAFSPWCTHLGCAYHWDQAGNQFSCPCHGSRFALNGEVLRGPASRPLDRYEVRIEGNRVWLGRTTKPESAGA